MSCPQVIKRRYKTCMFYYMLKELQLSKNEVIVTLIVTLLFSVSVCMNIPLIWQDDYNNKFSNDSTIIFFISKFKVSLSQSIPI